MNMKRISLVPLMILAVAGLASCGTISQGVAKDGASAKHLVWPDASHAAVRGGTFPNIANLRTVAPGMTKDQLYQLFGRPHFNEGVFGVREWDYLFNLRVGQGSRYVSCEFKVLFDEHHLAQSFYWKPASCADLVNPKPVAPPPPAPAPLPDKPISLSADALFDFDKSNLKPAGIEALNNLLDEIRSASQVQNIDVTGYTDRIGTDAYNMKLSKERADSVRNYLVGHGVSADSISAKGLGKADPVKACDHAPAGELIKCLAPNRRVEISGEAKK